MKRIIMLGKARRKNVIASRSYMWIACLLAVSCLAFAGPTAGAAERQVRAGAAKVDITPARLPILVNGWVLQRTAKRVLDRLHSRAIVLEADGRRMAMVVVDNLMMDVDMLDEAKALASDTTGIPADRMMVSANHIHSAPSASGCLGTPIDQDYRKFLIGKIAESIELAAKSLQPVRIGWAVADAYPANQQRRYIMLPKTADGFAKTSSRANDVTGPGDHVISPTGPTDSRMAVISLKSLDDRPVAVMANLAFHFISPHHGWLSSDAAGYFGTAMTHEFGIADGESSFVGILSQGPCGDTSPGRGFRRDTPEAYAEDVARRAAEACSKMKYYEYAPIDIAQHAEMMPQKQPTPQQLATAQKIVEAMGDRAPKTGEEVYALEAVYLHARPEKKVIVQAIRIGELGLVALPDEVFGLTGLKLRAQDPLPLTNTISLANGSVGYLPPIEQYAYGGYTTQPARHAALLKEAESQIVDRALDLLEQLSGRKRVMRRPEPDEYVRQVLQSKPYAFWPMDDMWGQAARDISGNEHNATYEPGVAFFLPGRTPAEIDYPERAVRRAALFAGGGRMVADVENLEGGYTVELWLWNGIAVHVRDVTGYISGIGERNAPDFASDQLYLDRIKGDKPTTSTLAFSNGQGAKVSGKTALKSKTWYHVALVRQGSKVSGYINGRQEFTGKAAFHAPKSPRLFLGGRHDKTATWEGRIHDASFHQRALEPAQVTRHFHFWRPKAAAHEDLSIEIDPAAGHESITINVDDVDATPLGAAAYDDSVNYVVGRSIRYGDQAGETVTFRNLTRATTFEVTLAIEFDYLGQAYTDEDTCTLHVAKMNLPAVETDATWTGGAVLPSGKTGTEWWRGRNWLSGPPAADTDATIVFGNDGPGINSIARDRKTGAVSARNYTGNHTTDLNGNTLAVQGDLSLVPPSGSSRYTITNGTLRLGTENVASNLTVTHGTLHLDAELDMINVHNVAVPNADKTATGALVLSGAGIFKADKLHIASESPKRDARSTGSLVVPENSKLEKITISDSFRIAASETGNWQTALTNGYDTGDGQWMLPSGISFEIGSREDPASIVSVGHGHGWSKRGRFVVGEGGTFTANVKLLQVGTMSGGGTGWWGSMQPEVKWTAPYGVGNDFHGVLDISRMAECDITADAIAVGYNAEKSWGTQLIGRLLLPKGNVTASTVTVGHAFPVSEERNSEAYRPGCEGRIELKGTVLAVRKSLAILKTGVVEAVVSGSSSGLDLAADAEVSIDAGGTLKITLTSRPTQARRYYGFRWQGDHKDVLNELIRKRAITVNADALGADSQNAGVFTATEKVAGAATTFTYIGLPPRNVK